MRQIAKKLRSRSGETIAETLVALLVGVLALMVLAGMISATSRIVKKSEAKMDDYYKECATLATFETEDSEGIEDGVVEITISESGESGESSTVSCPVKVYNNTIFANHTVTAYQMTTASDSTDDGSGD